MSKTFILFFLLLMCHLCASAQRVHSHNDYKQNVPFWKAYAAGVSSIEADVFLINDTLFVAHYRHEVQPQRTLEALYLNPIRLLFDEKIMESRPFQLLIDVKTEAYSTLDKIVEMLLPLQNHLYPNNPVGVKIIISGSRPRPINFNNYPNFIFFDWQSTEKPENIDRVAMVSLNFMNISLWRGNRAMNDEERMQVSTAIADMRRLGKPIRFWASPDTQLAWLTLHRMGVDFIGTGRPDEAMFFLRSFSDFLPTSNP
jgi:alkaline phosphatase